MNYEHEKKPDQKLNPGPLNLEHANHLSAARLLQFLIFQVLNIFNAARSFVKLEQLPIYQSKKIYTFWFSIS